VYKQAGVDYLKLGGNLTAWGSRQTARLSG